MLSMPMDETLFLQDEQNFLGTPLPAQWIFLLCLSPHLGQMHSMEFFLVAIYLISLPYSSGLLKNKSVLSLQIQSLRLKTELH